MRDPTIFPTTSRMLAVACLLVLAAPAAVLPATTYTTLVAGIDTPPKFIAPSETHYYSFTVGWVSGKGRTNLLGPTTATTARRTANARRGQYRHSDTKSTLTATLRMGTFPNIGTAPQ